MGFRKVRDIPKRRFLFSLFILTSFLFVIWFSPRLFFINFSTSLPRGIYFRVPLAELKVGDIVAYMPPDDIVSIMREHKWIRDDQRPFPFLKYVGALPGDMFSVQDRDFSINGKYMGDILESDSRGRPLPHLFNGSYLVGEGKFLPLSSDAHGFDGRYTGCVPLERIIAKVVPLWVVY